MTESPLNPDPPKSSWLNTFYQQNQLILDRILFAVITAVLASVFHVKLSDVQSAAVDSSQTAHEVKDVQAKKVAVEVRGTDADVATLKAVVEGPAATQPTEAK